MDINEILKKGKVVEPSSSGSNSALDSILKKGKLVETQNVTDINPAQKFVDKVSKKAEDTYGKDSLLYKATAPARLASKALAFLWDNKKEIATGVPKVIKNTAKTFGTQEGREQFAISFVDGGIPSIKNVVYNYNDLFYGGVQKVFEKVGAETLANWAGQDKQTSRLEAKKANNEVKDFLKSYNLTYDNQNDTRNFWERITAEDGTEEIAKVAGMQLPTFLALLGVGVATKGASAATIPSILATSFALNAGDAYQQGKDYLEEKNIPMTPEWEGKLSRVATLVGVATAPLDAYGLDKIMKPSSFVSFKNIMARNVTNAILDVGVDMVAEGGTEGLQEIIQNAWAKTYNDNQNLFEGVPEAMFGGGLFAGGSSTLVNITNIITGGSETNTTTTTEPKTAQTFDLNTKNVEAVSPTIQQAVDNVAKTVDMTQISDIGKTVVEEIAHSEGTNIERSIAQDPSLESFFYQDPQQKILTEQYAQQRVNDVTQKLDSYKKGLGEKMSSAVDVKNTTYDNIVTKGLEIIQNAIKADQKTGASVSPQDFGGAASVVFNSAGLMSAGIAQRLKEGVPPEQIVTNIVESAKKAGVEFTEEKARNAVNQVVKGYDQLTSTIAAKIQGGLSVNKVAQELVADGMNTEQALALVERVSQETTTTKETKKTAPVEQKALSETIEKLQEVDESVLNKTPADLQKDFNTLQDTIDTKLSELTANVNEIRNRLAEAPDRSALKKTTKIELSKAQEALRKAEKQFNDDLVGNATSFREFLSDFIPKNYDVKLSKQQLDDVIDGVVIQSTDPTALRTTFDKPIRRIIEGQLAQFTKKTAEQAPAQRKKGEIKVGDTVVYKNRKNKEQKYRVEVVGELIGISKINSSGEVSQYINPVKPQNLLVVTEDTKNQTQKEKVKEAVKEKGKATIKEIAKETGILEPNVRRILGVGTKDGTFERVDSGVYRLTIGDQEVAVVIPADAVETLPKLAENGFKADMVFLDIPYDTPAVKGGNRGVEYDLISVEDFGKVLDATQKILKDADAPIIHFFSQAPSGMKKMQKYNDLFGEKGFTAIGRGEYQKVFQNGKPVTSPNGKVAQPEGIIVFNQSGKVSDSIKSLNFKILRPKGYQTEKSAEAVRQLIEMTTKEGDVILDPFAGSGVVGAEAVKAGRRSVSIEKKSDVAEKFTKPRIAKAVEIADAINTLKEQIGDVFDFVEPNGSLWHSKGNTIFISQKKPNAGFLNWLRGKNFIKSAEEAGNNVYKVEVKVKEKPKSNEYATQNTTFYHGTLASFENFDAKRRGENTQYENAKWGFFFISDKSRASQFVEDTRGAGDQRKANVMEVKLDIKNPIDLTIKGIVTKKEQASLIYEIMTGEKVSPEQALKELDDAIDLGTVGEFFEELYSNVDAKKKIEEAGYDGIVAEFGRDNGKVILEYVAFNPEQIKVEAPADQVAVINKDVGEKIGGAAKDKYQKQAEGYKETYTVEELRKLPLAKMLPQLDFQNLKENNVPEYLIQSYIYNKTRLGRRPVKGSKLNSWLRQVLVLRDLGRAMFNKDSEGVLRSVFMTISSPFGGESKTVSLDKLASEVPSIGLTFDLYEKYNYLEDNAIREFSVTSIREGRSGEGKTTKDYLIRRNEKYFASIMAENIEEFYKKFDEKYKDYLTRSTNKKSTGSTFQKYLGLYRDRSSGNYLVMYKNGKREFTLANYKTLEEAKTARNNEENIKNWEEKFNKATGFDENSFREHTIPTIGSRKYRSGDVSAEQFMSNFGFRGVEFGNWLNQEDRRIRLNSAYDSFKDLAVILGVPDQALSLNGELGFAFGSRGKKGAMAHYEPMKVVVNITKENGAGTIAHEWWHALDNYFSRKADNKLGYLTDMPRRYPRKELSDAVDNLMDTIYKSDVYKRSKVADKYKGRPYYTNHTELGARAFEIYVREKLASQNLKNGFLVQVPNIELKGSPYEEIHPYAVGEEIPTITEAMDNVVKNLLVKEEEGKQVLYKIKGGKTEMAGVEEATNFLNDFKNRLKLDFDVKFVNAILASKDGVITKEAYGATLDNTVVIVKEMAKHTAEHEVVHLTLANMSDIPVFDRNGMTRDKILQAKADLMGIEYDEMSAREIEEALALDFENFVAGKAKPQGIIRKFFVMLKNLLTNFAKAIGLTGGDIITEYYDILTEGKAVQKEMNRLENKGIVNSFLQEGVLDVSSLEDLSFKEKEGDKRLGDLEKQFNQLSDKQQSLEEDVKTWRTDIEGEMIKKSETAEVINETDENVKEASRYTNRTKEPVGDLTARGVEVVEKLGFENTEEAQQEIRDYLRRKVELIETRNRLRTLRRQVAEAVKGGKENKQALRDVERRLKMRQKFLEKKDYYVKMGVERGKKQQMRIIWKRGRAIKNAQDFFGISDAKAKTIIQNRNIRLMSEAEFNDFLIEFANKAKEMRGKLDAQDTVNALIAENQYNKVDNLRRALKLPSIPQMSEAEAESFADILSGFEFGDVFLTQRQIETIHRTNWGDLKTEREVLEVMNEKMGVDPATLQDLSAPDEQGGKYIPWIKLARKHPFYNWLVGKRFEAKIKAEKEFFAIEHELQHLASKARSSRRKMLGLKGKVAETLIPTDDIVFGYMESENKEQYATENKMTQAELDFARYLIAQYYGAWEYLSSEYGMKERKNYMTHIRRTFWEALKADGVATAIRETFISQKEEEAAFKILDEETGNTIAFEKFFNYAMRRSGQLVPSKNVVRSSLAYFKAFTNKKAMDAFVPEALIAVQAHKAVVGTTEKGLTKDPTFEAFVKKYLNDAKGRRIDFVTKQGSKLDIGLRAGISWIAIKYLGLNVATAVANFIGDYTAVFWELSVREGLKGIARSINIPKSRQINKEYRYFTGRNPIVEMFDPKYNMPQRALKSVTVLMELALFSSNKFFLRSKMTDAEWKSGVIEDSRMTEIAQSLSRAKPNAFYVNSLVGNTTAGRGSVQFGGWAFPIFNALTSDAQQVYKMLKEKKGWEAVKSEEAQKIAKFAIMVGLSLFAVTLIDPPDDDDNSFKARILRKAQRELTTLFQALQFVTDPRNYALIVQEVGLIAEMVNQLLSGEEYTTDGVGYGIGDKKWTKTLKRIVTPTVIRNAFYDNTRTNTKEDLIQEAIKSEDFNPDEIVDFLYSKELAKRDGKELDDYRAKKVGEIEALYNLRKNYDTPLADIIISSDKNEDKVKAMIEYTKEVGVDKAYGEVKELYHDRNLCSDTKKKTGCLVSGQLFKDYQKAKNKLND